MYRTRNAGRSWEPLTRGLPQKGAYETVVRDAMTADALQPGGIYFGTRSGQIFGSADDGKTWKRILAGLPSIVCVKAAYVGEPADSRSRRSTGRRTTPRRRAARPAARKKTSTGRRR